MFAKNTMKFLVALSATQLVLGLRLKQESDKPEDFKSSNGPAGEVVDDNVGSKKPLVNVNHLNLMNFDALSKITDPADLFPKDKIFAGSPGEGNLLDQTVLPDGSIVLGELEEYIRANSNKLLSDTKLVGSGVCYRQTSADMGSPGRGGFRVDGVLEISQGTCRLIDGTESWIKYSSEGPVEKGIAQKKDGQLKGISRVVHSDGSRVEETWAEDELNGPFSVVTSDGTEEYGNYKDGELHGLYRRIESDGRILLGHYTDGQKDGEWLTVDADGNTSFVLPSHSENINHNDLVQL